MKAQPLLISGNMEIPCSPEEATHILMHSPGPIKNILLPVQIKGPRKGTGNWTWNGDVEKPTLKPSVLHDFRPNDSLVNHIWITDGKVIFLKDSTHELAGETLDLLDL